MYCPKCKIEYVYGPARCTKCESELVETLDGNDEYITLLETGDKALMAVVKSVLEGSGIRFIVTGEELHDLFGLGGIGYNPLIGAMKIMVPKKDAEDAAKLLELLDSDELPWEDAENPEEE